MECEMHPNLPAEVHVTYGLYTEYEKGRPYWEHDLSIKAALELWDKCSGLVSNQLMYWKNERIKQLKSKV